MTSRAYAQNHSKMVSRARLPVCYCIMQSASSLHSNVTEPWLVHVGGTGLSELINPHGLEEYN